MDEPRPEEHAEEHAEEQAADRSAAPPPVPVWQLADRPLTEPHPDRLSPDDPAYPQIIRSHSDALDAGADTYVDPRTGYTVLTAAYLARRGTCCESGCRHCPYVR
jgi:hypothetical protein